MPAVANNTAPKLNELTLIADIGATNARFAIMKANGEFADILYLPCKDYPNFIDAATEYIASCRIKPNNAVIAVACPVLSDEVNITNNHWKFSIQHSRAELGLNNLKVVNDFTAMAYAMPNLGPDDAKHIGGRKKQHDESMPIGVIGPGSGLGVGGLMPSANGEWTPIITEGGHVTLAATTEEEERIIHLMREKYGHVTAERLISGPGLVNLYHAHCTFDDVTPKDLEPMDVSDLSMKRQDKQCIKATKTFSELLGTVAGNLALTMGAHGGVYLAGGIIKKMENAFDEKAFRNRFEAKNPQEDFMKPIPTYVIISRHIAFLGLRHIAQQG